MNAGGTVFVTSRETLTKQPDLSIYLSVYPSIYLSISLSRVNAGGTVFVTSRETLTKQPDSVLAQVHISIS